MGMRSDEGRDGGGRAKSLIWMIKVEEISFLMNGKDFKGCHARWSRVRGYLGGCRCAKEGTKGRTDWSLRDKGWERKGEKGW